MAGTMVRHEPRVGEPVGLNEVRPRWPEQLVSEWRRSQSLARVSMKSGLDGRNNPKASVIREVDYIYVSMKSGLDGRNNCSSAPNLGLAACQVSMKSGLDGRNNPGPGYVLYSGTHVSMKSGLDGRNNYSFSFVEFAEAECLNEVRPRWPEQWLPSK